MIQIMIANLINMVIGIGNSFLLPKFLSVETYAMVKTYALYISYASIFCLGYNEGMYLKYGGKDIKDINKEDLTSNFCNYLILEMVVTIVMLVIGIVGKNFLIASFAIGKMAFNIIGYMKSLYQATGEFSLYGKSLNIEKIGVFLLNLLLLFVLKSDEYKFYILIQIVVGVLTAIYLCFKIKDRINSKNAMRFQFQELKENVSSGFILMLGNFSSSIFTGLDRWFVKLLLTTADFAYYSFAVSIESLINVFVVPITVSMYNYFCKGISKEEILKIKKVIMIWGFVIISIAFPIKWVVVNYLDKYIDALDIIFILLAAQPFYAVIKGIYVNLYKAEKNQSKYLKQMLGMIIVGITLNTVGYIIFRNMASIAYATLITSIIWLSVCEGDGDVRFSKRDILAGIIVLLSYLVLGKTTKPVLGLVIYLIIGMGTLCTLMNDTLRYIIGLIKTKIRINR